MAQAKLAKRDCLFWRCPKCGELCTMYQTATDGWKAIYSDCCGVKNPPEVGS